MFLESHIHRSIYLIFYATRSNEGKSRKQNKYYHRQTNLLKNNQQKKSGTTIISSSSMGIRLNMEFCYEMNGRRTKKNYQNLSHAK